MERCRRLVFVLLAAVLLIPMFRQGHGAPSREEHVAFFRSPSLPVVVRVTGDVQAPGVYRLPAGATVATVMNMTLPFLVDDVSDPLMLAVSLKSGAVVRVTTTGRQRIEITIDAMKAKERMILGIPLHPDLMDAEDWDALPGIGPVMAKKIVEARQKYGEFGSVENLQRVPGVGKNKVDRLRPYFQ